MYPVPHRPHPGLQLAGVYRACVLLYSFWNASVVPPGFGHRHRVSAQVQNMRYEACVQEMEAIASANSLGNSFRNIYADYGVVRKRASYGYPLDEDGNYPKGWF